MTGLPKKYFSKTRGYGAFGFKLDDIQQNMNVKQGDKKMACFGLPPPYM